MSLEETELSPSLGKHKRSPARGDEVAEETPKRRKHHRHHHHHHRHRRHGKHERDGDEAKDDEKHNRSLPVPSSVDDEREEGEILEEEEAIRSGSGKGSDIESGEIEPEIDDAVLNPAQKSNNCPPSINSLAGKIEDLTDGRDSSTDSGVKTNALPLDEERETQDALVKGTRREKKHQDTRTGDLKSQTRSGSPFSGESLTKLKIRGASDTRYSEGDQERPDLESQGDTRNRESSVSRGRKREEPYSNGSSRAKQYDSEVYDRNGSEPERVRHDRVDRHRDSGRDDDRGFHKRRERSRSRSYSRHDQRDDRHSSREKGRDREKYSGSFRDNVEVDKESRRERERSISHSRHNVSDDRLALRDGGRDIHNRSSVRDRDRERPRDEIRESHRERERLRDSKYEKDRAKDGSGSYRDRCRVDREHRERGSSRDRHMDFRNKYDGDHRRERSRFNEFPKDSKSDTPDTEKGKEKATREENQEVYVEKIEEQLAYQEEEDVEKIKEESRKRRLAIMEKFNQQKMQQQAQCPPKDHGKEEHASPDTDKDNQPELDSSSPARQAIPEVLESRHDPSDVYVADASFTVGKSSVQNGAMTPERTDGARGLGEGTPKSEKSADMFCDDIFGESPSGVRKMGKGDGVQVERSGLHDNWDDSEGYYSYRLGEVLDGRYEVKSFHGKGVFSTVVRAKDLKAGEGDPEEVAIKIIRSNDTMYKAGLDELVILKKLVGADPEDRRHCVRFLSSFKYRNHLCLVFESLHMNLREVLKKFGRNIGLNLTAVRAYAKQLFIALKHLRSCGVLHCDIKPDNMLVNEAKNVLKLCDFGNAMFAGKNEITPYLVSRFYRAPEIILGLQYDHPMDIWSVGCCLYELYTGKVLFPGPSNNDMLRLHMELRGPFPKKMLRKGAFIDQHYDQDLNFHAIEEDPVTKKTVRRLLLNIKQKDIGNLMSSSLGEDPKLLANFKDLLERIFTLDPEKRMTVYQALTHPFITGK